MRAPPNYGQGNFAADVADAISEDTGRTNRLNNEARCIVDEALDRFGGPCPAAYADVLNRYISAPPGGRDALFLAVAYRAVGTSSPTQIQRPDRVAQAVVAPVSVQHQSSPWLFRAIRHLAKQFGR